MFLCVTAYNISSYAYNISSYTQKSQLHCKTSYTVILLLYNLFYICGIS